FPEGYHAFRLRVANFLRSYGHPPPMSPSFYPDSSVSDDRSVQVGRTHFSRCCHPINGVLGSEGQGSARIVGKQELDLVQMTVAGQLLLFARHLTLSV